MSTESSSSEDSSEYESSSDTAHSCEECKVCPCSFDSCLKSWQFTQDHYIFQKDLIISLWLSKRMVDQFFNMIFPPELSYHIIKLQFQVMKSKITETITINRKLKVKRILFYDKEGSFKTKHGYYSICHCDQCHKIYWERDSLECSQCVQCEKNFCSKCTYTLRSKPGTYDTLSICIKCYNKECFICEHKTMGRENICSLCGKTTCCECISMYKREWYCKLCRF